MNKTIFKEPDTAHKLIPPELPESRPARERTRCAPSSPQNEADLIPYSAKDLKYMWTLWDEAQRHHQVRLRYRNIYAGALGVILAGWLCYMIRLPFSAALGGILMLAGSLTGAWYCLKSLRHKGHSAPGK